MELEEQLAYLEMDVRRLQREAEARDEVIYALRRQVERLEAQLAAQRAAPADPRQEGLEQSGPRPGGPLQGGPLQGGLEAEEDGAWGWPGG